MRLSPLSKDIAWRERGIDSLVGALGVLALAPFHAWPAMLLSVAMMYVRLSTRATPAAGYSTAFWTGMGYFGVGMVWIAQAFVERGPEFIPLILPLVVGLFILLSIFWGIAGWAFGRVQPQGLWRVAGFVSFLWLAEFTRGHLFGGFPWNLHGYAFDAGTALSQSASVFGVYGLSLVVLAIGALLGQAWKNRAPIPAVLAATLLGTNFGYGMWRLNSAKVELLEGPRLRLVHVPFRQREMMQRERSIELTNQFFSETLSAPLEGITHIVWPEGAVRGLAIENEDFLSVFPNALPETQSLPVFLFSSIREEWKPDPDGGVERLFYNSAVAAAYPDRAPAIAAFSDKKRLVPFSEYVPFPDILSAIGFEAIATSFTPAPDKNTSNYPGLPPVSVQICYEVLFPGLTEGEPEFILNQSNDAWFGNWHGPAQHAATARMRAVEEGAPILRSAANGWSGTIDSYGRWQERMGPDERGYLDVGLPTRIAPTPFNRLTNIMLLLIILSVATSTIVAGRFKPRGVGQTGVPVGGG